MAGISAIVLAAGQGKRMKSNVQKQFMMLNDYPVIYYALKAFEDSSVDEIVLVTGASEIDYCKEEIVDRFGFKKVSAVVAGGKERYDSVYNGLNAVKGDYVLIHDGARPLVTVDIIERTIDEVKMHDACVVGMPVKDTIKVSDETGMVVSTPPRKTLWQVQTPQAFKTEVIIKAHRLLREEAQSSINVTDDSMLVEELLKKPVKLVEGSYENIKVTTPEDIAVAGAFLAAR